MHYITVNDNSSQPHVIAVEHIVSYYEAGGYGVHSAIQMAGGWTLNSTSYPADITTLIDAALNPA